MNDSRAEEVVGKPGSWNARQGDEVRAGSGVWEKGVPARNEGAGEGRGGQERNGNVGWRGRLGVRGGWNDDLPGAC